LGHVPFLALIRAATRACGRFCGNRLLRRSADTVTPRLHKPSHIDPRHTDPQKISGELEAAFRALKSELAIRPLFHQLE
jgi:hypothetical protein